MKPEDIVWSLTIRGNHVKYSYAVVHAEDEGGWRRACVYTPEHIMAPLHETDKPNLQTAVMWAIQKLEEL